MHLYGMIRFELDRELNNRLFGYTVNPKSSAFRKIL